MSANMGLMKSVIICSGLYSDTMSMPFQLLPFCAVYTFCLFNLFPQWSHLF